MNLDEALALKNELLASYEPAATMGLVQKRIDQRRLNGFLRSILDRPLRELPQIFTTHEPIFVGAAQSGHRLQPAAMIPAMRAALIAQSAGEKSEPNVSIGYSAIAKNKYRLEIRLQAPTVAAVLFAQEAVQRAKGEARIAEYRDLRAHAVGAAGVGAAKLLIGNSIGHAKCQAGTLGLFMRSPNGVGVLSNSHVLAWSGRARRGDPIFAPHPQDSPSPVKVGRLLRFSSLIQDDVIRFDAAFATLNDGVAYNGNSIPDGVPDAGKKVVEARHTPVPGTLKVCKIGRTSRYTSGTLAAIGVDPRLQYPGLGEVKLTGMLEILWDSPNKAFSDAGDSGSVVYRPDTMEAIGLVVGGGVRIVDGVAEGVTIACPLDQVMTEWNLSLA